MTNMELVFVGLALHLVVFGIAVNHRVDGWGWWLFTNPGTTGMVTAGVGSAMSDAGYRTGGADMFYLRCQDGVPVSLFLFSGNVHDQHMGVS